MIQTADDWLILSPDGYPGTLSIRLQRTLRLPPKWLQGPQPVEFGWLPLRSVDDYADRLPPAIVARGGVIVPIWQSDAVWVVQVPPRAGKTPAFTLVS